MKRTKKTQALPVAPPATETVESRPAPIIRNDFVWTRLRVGDVILYDSRRHVVVMVSECRARAIPLAKRRVSYDTVSGKKVEFDTDYASINISPNSEGPILERLGPEWKKSLAPAEQKMI